MTPATFSILGYDPATGEVGGAVQSHVIGVLRLQVDDSPRPLVELRRLVELAEKQRRPRQ